MPYSSLLTVIGTVVDEGFLERVTHSHYRVTLKFWRIGCGAVDHETMRERVLPKLLARPRARVAR